MRKYIRSEVEDMSVYVESEHKLRVFSSSIDVLIVFQVNLHPENVQKLWKITSNKQK